jgi:carbamoyl-phosphate synthase large subunit
MSRRVLLTSGGTGVGNAVLTAIRRSAHSYTAATTNAEPFHSGVFRADLCRLVPASEHDPDEWSRTVLNMAGEEEARLVIPCRDRDVPALARIRDELRARGAVAVCPDEELAAACLDKMETAALLEEIGLPAAATVLAGDAAAVDHMVRARGFPVIVKPRRGTGTVGVRLVRTAEALASFIALAADRAHEWIVQEYLPIEGPLHSVTQYTELAQDREYSIQVLFNADGCIATWMATVNTLENGLPVAARFDRSPAVAASVARLPQPFRGMSGPLNLQGRMRGDEIVFFEVNARCTGLTGSRTFFGLNEVDVFWDTLVEGRPAPEVVYNADICIYRQLEDTAFAVDDLRRLSESRQWRR